tara:strand:- start:1597 stop:2007 length:411 start_codon:yes stop_codon:yes gene_type:complete
MCIGPFAPKIEMPEIVYQGPSEQDLADQRQILTDYTTTSEANTKAFQETIDARIATAQASTDSILDQLKETSAQAGAGIENLVNEAPYAITTEDNVDPEDAQVTQKISKKKKKPSTLKIAAGGLTSTAGTGVNYGV